MRAAIYVRVSTDKQEDSPERQRHQVVPFCRDRGYRVVHEYLDLAERGWDHSRSEFRKMLDAASRKEFDVIVVDEASRLSRQDPYEFMAMVAYPLRTAGVSVVVVAEDREYRWDGDDLADAVVSFIGQYRANQESKSMARRVVTGLAEKAQRAAIQVGKPPYGYRRQRHEGRPRLVLGPAAEVSTVQFIYDCYIRRDMSLADICRALERRGSLSPTGLDTWRPNTVRKILRDEAYTGAYVFNRRHAGRFYRSTRAGVERSTNTQWRSLDNPREDWFVVPNNHEAIVTHEDFLLAQDALTNNRRRTTPLGGRGDFLFSRILRCGDCGAWMCGLRGGRRRPGYVAYRCGRASPTGRCSLNIVVEDEVRTAILATLRQRFLSPHFLGRLRQMARAIDEQSSSDDERECLHREDQELDRRIARAKKNLSLLDDDLLGSVVEDIRRWQARKQQIAEALAQGATATSEELESLVAEVERILADHEDAMLDGDRDKFRSVLRRRVAWVEVCTEKSSYGRRQRYRLAGGKVVLRPDGAFNALAGAQGGCFSLLTTPASDEQARTWQVAVLAQSSQGRDRRPVREKISTHRSPHPGHFTDCSIIPPSVGESSS
jgi:DNA invertase Pin-like site-specific DNA recombinase